MSEGHSDPKEQQRRLRLAAEVFAHLADAQIDHLSLILLQAYMAGQTQQQAAVDAAAYLNKPDHMPDAGPTPADLRGEVVHDA